MSEKLKITPFLTRGFWSEHDRIIANTLVRRRMTF